MQDTQFFFDNFSSYLTSPMVKDSGLDLPIRPQYQRTMEKVRDTFVLLCNLGQRHSDIRRIAPEHFSRGTFKIIPKLPHGDRGQEVLRALVVQDLREVYLNG